MRHLTTGDNPDAQHRLLIKPFSRQVRPSCSAKADLRGACGDPLEARQDGCLKEGDREKGRFTARLTALVWTSWEAEVSTNCTYPHSALTRLAQPQERRGDHQSLVWMCKTLFSRCQGMLNPTG